MARNAGVVVENNFTNGLVTEATGLNFPENAVTETDNCVFEPTSRVRRRDGLGFEEDWVPFTNYGEDNIVTEYLWESVAGDGNLSFLVQQIGNVLFFMAVSENTPLSSTPVHIHDLMTSATDPSQINNNPVSLSDGLGRLVISHPYCNPSYMEYNKETGVFSHITFEIMTRDFVGVEPQPVPRNTEISNTHLYNLRNQGWPNDRISEFRSKAGFYPSDYEVWWLYKRADQYGNEIFLPSDIFGWQTALDYIDRGNSPAPKGAIILNEFYQDRSGVTGIGGLPTVTSGFNRPSACAFHAGRVFFSGVNYGDYSSKVYFSQIVEKPNQFGRCYQYNDPTSQYSPDLLPSDGGVISVPDAGNILKLWSINTSLLVIATNGIWEITGSSGIGFTAIDYTVKKISSLTTLSTLSFVSVNGVPFWWGQDGIYAAASAGDAAGLQIRNVSDSKIKTFFDDILEESRKYAKGAFNSRDQVIQWIYRSTPASNLEERYSYDKVLNFDTRGSAYYPWTIADSNWHIKGIVSVKGMGQDTVNEIVRDNTNAVVTNTALETVTVERDVDVVNSSKFKYLANDPSINAWAYTEQKPNTRRDWTNTGTSPGIPFSSYFVSGYRLRGNAITNWQSNYIRLFNEGDGMVILYSRWDYSNSSSSSRWSSPQQVVFDDNLYDVQTRRRKIRGHGLSMQVTIQSFEDNDFNLIGWSTFDSSNARP